VLKADYARLGYYDIWLPQLAPSAGLVRWAKGRLAEPRSWKVFERQYLRELSHPDTLRLLELLSAFSRQTDFSIGCYCEDERECHRSILRKVLAEHGAQIR